ncbi:MAG: methyltransferase domain-containing protein [Candidatus Saccharimonadales bacterium]
MTQSLLILGRQPALGLAELESLFGAENLTPVGRQAVRLNCAHETVNFNRLGGSMTLAKVIGSADSTDWGKIVHEISRLLPELLKDIPEGKIRFGISTYGLPVKPSTINRSGLDLKKIIKSGGRSIRIVPNTNAELNTAQIIHNQLTGPTGIGLVLVRDDKQTIIAQITQVQDIDAYAARDQKRPKRDSRVGMLPPKLAQIIINIAVGQPTEQITVLDPFCGTGVLLQEALLMGYNAHGTDLEQRMIDYSQVNLEWLSKVFSVPNADFKLEAGDATSFEWSNRFDFIAAETYLGRPFSAIPSPEVLSKVMQDVDTIHRKFLRNVAQQTDSGFKMCIAVPAWKTKSGFKHLQILDSLEDLGYTRRVFVHANKQDLIYHRPEQIVGRELVVLQRR